MQADLGAETGAAGAQRKENLGGCPLTAWGLKNNVSEDSVWAPAITQLEE